MRPHALSESATPAVSDRTGDYLVLPGWSPSSPDLYAVPGVARPPRDRLKSGDDGTQTPRGLICPSSGSATPAVSDVTGRQASYSFFQSCYRNPLGQHGQGSVTVIMSRPWFLIFARLPGQRLGKPQALLTSRFARSLPTCHPEVELCKVWFVSAATSRTPSSDSIAKTVMPTTKTASTNRTRDRREQPRTQTLYMPRSTKAFRDKDVRTNIT